MDQSPGQMPMLALYPDNGTSAGAAHFRGEARAMRQKQRQSKLSETLPKKSEAEQQPLEMDGHDGPYTGNQTAAGMVPFLSGKARVVRQKQKQSKPSEALPKESEAEQPLEMVGHEGPCTDSQTAAGMVPQLLEKPWWRWSGQKKKGNKTFRKFF